MKTREQMEEETYNAKKTDIRFLAEHFGYNLKKTGGTYICQGTRNSLVLFAKTNSFFDFYANTGGSTIDFVMRETGQDIHHAIEYINALSGFEAQEQERDTAFQRERDAERTRDYSRELNLPPQNENHRRVFAYLSKSRGISNDIISDMLHRHLLYESADRHNAVFVGYDANGCAKHGFIRGTITNIQYRGDCGGSDKNYGFSVPGKNDELLVFEAPIDLLSFMSLFPENNSHKLALGMLADAPIYTYIEEHPEINKISFLLDNDLPGIEATTKYCEKLKQEGFTAERNQFMDRLGEGQKDVNDYLIAVRNAQQTQTKKQCHRR